jgi:ribonucleoside-diphosphate reductase alpha subunit
MQVVKRDGRIENLDFSKIHFRIKSMCCKKSTLEFQKEQRPEAYEILHNLPSLDHADVDLVAKKTIEGVYNNIPTTEIDKLSAEIAQEMCTIHPDNSVLATRIVVSNLKKNLEVLLIKRFPEMNREEINQNLFKYVMRTLYFNLDKKGEHSPLVAPYLAAIAEKYSDRINSILNYTRDFLNHDYLGIKMLEKGYLFRVNAMEGFSEKQQIVETPSMSDMRIAIGLACAPSPCPELYERKKVLDFISKFPEVVKEKHRVQDLSVLQNFEQPHKHKYINSKLFKKLYWENELKKSMKTVTVSAEQWGMIVNTYDGMTLGKFTPASPSRFSLGSTRPQGSSCFLVAMKDDSLKGIYDTLAEQAQLSKFAGGVGVHVSNIRSTGSYIGGTNGNSNGLKPMIRVFNASTEYVDQGGRREGSIAIYLEPWHSDILDFCALRRKKGADSDRARRLFYALWIPDEFFRCLKEKKDWYLFDPASTPKLYDSYDEEFSSSYLTDEYVIQNKERLNFTYHYRKYIRQGKFEKKINPADLLNEVVETVKESGVPYMLAKDACNRKSNQKNIGVIRSSNLCAEIVQYSDATNTATCNLSSICLNKFVRKFEQGDDVNFKYNVSLKEGEEDYYTYDFVELGKIVRVIVTNIDRLIDLNFYPTEASRNSNMKTRAQGIGTQGESDVLAMLRLPWNSKEANRLRFYIYERIYYEALKRSMELSKENGPYSAFPGSPASQGKLQFDLWKDEGKKISFSMSMKWDELKENIARHGLRHSLLTCAMPTASTSSIMSNSASIEPFNSLVYVRKSGAGDVTMINKNLVKDLMGINLWNKSISDKILLEHGTIQNIIEIPLVLRKSYLTVYDMEPKDLIDAAFVRGWFMDQSQSLNLFIKNVTMTELSNAWTRGWSRGLKTLSYYIRSKPATTAQKAQIEKTEKVVFEDAVCSRDNPDCVSCGS